ncbi:hypothetical protein O181_039227 [Austropuccinia psidii MF-1]|uniref:Uncharacterized protein n=1 Tax=Austropuccinia psidii MF-1 TaxID=1389203 RepID=A0A9Q3HCP4_9BASI|nr:hypothetical protein [Austropuccinia psidii MF-1]
MSIFGPDIADFKAEIQKAFDLKDLGRAGLLLGCKDYPCLQLVHYINTLTQEYKLEKCALENTPLKPNIQLNNATKEEVEDLQSQTYSINKSTKTKG